MYTYSEEHINYIKKLKKECRIITFFRILIIVLFLILWELCAYFNVINTFLYSSPSKIIKTIGTLINEGGLFKHINITIYEVLISFIISYLIGLIISTIMWWNKKISKIIDPYITVLNSLPKVALGPLIILWVGASINSIIFMALLISTFITIIDIYNGFISVNNNYIIMLKSFGASKLQIFRKIIIPSNLLNIISCIKINISMNLIGLLPPVGENLSSNKYCSKYLSHYL
jgi:NitT/TauT family transport system permease protein